MTIERDEDEVPDKGTETAPPRRPRHLRRWVWWTMGIAAALAIVFLLVLAYVAHNAEPILRQRVIANLEQRFQTPVELDSLHISVLKGLQVSGSGLRIAAPERPGAPPMLSVRSFSFRTGVRQLMEPSMRIDIVRVEGLRLRIPPKQHVPDAEQPGVKTRHGLLARLHIPSRSADSASTHWKIVVDRVECSDVVLTIETDKPGKQPLVFPITDVTLHDVGRGAPMPFQAHLVNPKPVGEIASTGRFGPWRSDDPRETPVDGSYSFTHADLNTIKGISGILSSTGSYGGVLGRIDVTGTTETPDFSLDVSEHAVDLRTEFNATVDGTNGDTILNSVRATLRNTVLDVKGSVIRTGGEHQPAADLDVDEAQAAAQQEAVGHMIQLQVVSTHARVEDLLRLGAKTSPPLMDGAMTLRAQLTIPPGRVNVSKKMRVQGSFTIRAATFSNPQWQQTVDKLSARASGKPEQASAGAAPEPVASQMGGSFALDDAVLSISQLHYQMPGAQVDVAGKYSLDGDTFNFAGKARTDAKASEMLTGWKSLLAMPFNKLLEKDGAGVEVPVTISGTRSAPKFGVDAGKLAGQILSRFKKGGGQDQKVPGQKQPDQKQPDQKQPDQKQPDQSQPPPKP